MIRSLQVISLITGPLLIAIATFFWDGNRVGVTAGTIGMVGAAAWIYGLLGVWERITAWRGWVGGIGIVLAIAGITGAFAFSFQAYFEGIFGITTGEESLEAAAEHPIASLFVLWLPGPAFPLSLAALGLALAWSRLVPLWLAGLLFCGGIVFPLSRITRTEAIAHAADLLILAAFTALAVALLKGRLDRDERSTDVEDPAQV
ncbi:hypothetical protein GCM10029992_27940 [Glycomyces albus]